MSAKFARMKILVIEDEKKTATALQKGLEQNGYSVEVAYDGETAFELIKKTEPRLVISDIIMPKLNGIELCKKIKSLHPEIPVLMLSALDSKDTIVTGLDSGADDYLTKPFDFRELLARVRRLLKRSETSTDNSHLLFFSDIIMNLRDRSVTRADKKIELTSKEFTLLKYFMRKPNTVIPRADIARDVWNINYETGTNMVEVYINYLRNKMDKPFSKKLLHNVHGVGYILREE